MILSKKDRVILREMVRTDFKLRYQDSLLGYAWSLARPLFMFGVLYVVFVYILRVGGKIENYPTYLLLGIVIWTYFTEITQRSLSVIVERGDLIRKISLPRYLFVISVSISATINLSLSLIIVAIAGLLSGASVSSQIWLVPFLFLEIYVFALGLGFLLSSLYVRIRDVSYLWEITLQAGFYATPILYSVSQVPAAFQKIVLLSPVAQVIQDLRNILVTQQTETIWKLGGVKAGLIPVAISIVTLIGGFLYFRANQSRFAEEL